MESCEHYKALGKHIETLRKKIGMTHLERARALGVSQQTVYAYETGNRRVNVLTLGKLANILEVPVQSPLSLKKAPPAASHSLLSPAGERHLERYQRLSKTQQCFVDQIIDVLSVANSSRTN